jgi:hypothetical protein
MHWFDLTYVVYGFFLGVIAKTLSDRAETRRRLRRELHEDHQQ